MDVLHPSVARVDGVVDDAGVAVDVRVATAVVVGVADSWDACDILSARDASGV